MPDFTVELLPPGKPITITVIEAATKEDAEKVIEQHFPGCLIIRMEEQKGGEPTRWIIN